MTNLNELQFFVQVSQARSFTLAARQLGTPKSTVSRAIKRLEGRLGVRLIERTTRSMVLTEAGQLYLDRCVRVIEEAEQADLAIGALLAQPRGRLSIGAPVAFARAMLGPMLGEFLHEYPEIRVQLQLLDGPASTGSASIQERRLDIVIQPGPLEDSGLLVKPLLRVRLGAYASPGYLQGQTAPDSPANLRHHSCITKTCGEFGEPADCATWRLRRGTEIKEVQVDSRISVPDPMLIHQLAVSGAGVALLGQSAAQPDVEAGRLVRLLPDWEPEPVDLHALYSSRLAASPKIRVFLQFLRDRLGAKKR